MDKKAMTQAQIRKLFLDKVQAAESETLPVKELNKQARWVVAIYIATTSGDGLSRSDWASLFLEGVKPCKVSDVVNELFETQEDVYEESVEERIDEIVAMTYGETDS